MPKQRIFGLTVLLVVMTLSTAHAVGLEVALGGWQQSAGGDLSYKALPSDPELNVDNDLGYGTETRIHARAKIDMPLMIPNIYLLAAPIQFEGNGSKDVDFNFGDSTITGTAGYYSKVTLNQYDIGLYYGVPFLQTATLGMLNVDVGINARILELEAILSQDSPTSIYEKHSVTLAVPMVYLAAQLTPMDWLAIEAEARGITISGNSLYSVIGRVRFKVFGPAFVAAGYRYDSLDVDEDDLKAKFSVQGVFAEAGLKF